MVLRLVVLALLAAFGTGITIGSAASLGTLSSSTLSASSVVVSACGKGATSLDYTLVDKGAGYVVDRVNLRRAPVFGSGWLQGTTCDGRTIRIALNGTEVVNTTIATADMDGAFRVLSYDVPDITAGSNVDFSVVIQ